MKRIFWIGVILVAGFSAALKAQQHGEKDAGTTRRLVSANDDFSTLGNKMICPVMGSTFNASRDSLKSEYKGKIYIFCCPGCKPQFDKNPEKYIK